MGLKESDKAVLRSNLPAAIGGGVYFYYMQSDIQGFMIGFGATSLAFVGLYVTNRVLDYF